MNDDLVIFFVNYFVPAMLVVTISILMLLRKEYKTLECTIRHLMKRNHETFGFMYKWRDEYRQDTYKPVEPRKIVPPKPKWVYKREGD